MKVEIGSVSHGTLVPHELIVAFGTLLGQLDEKDEWLGLLNDAQDADEEDSSEIVADLIDALNEFAPPYCYFGVTEGDGSDFGFWVDIDRVREDINDGELEVYADTGDIPPDTHIAAVINERGNCTLFTRTALEERWGIV